MSAGDVVCTGWLVKSPPEKKLKRYAWRKRWFVLRRGRMSGNPDVLEYYRGKSSKKPIRTIDLRECQVQMHTEIRLLKRELQNQHLFVVKTSSRIFYLVAKTEEEMNSWVRNISQICHFSPLDEEAADSDSFSQQPSPASSTHTSHITSHDLSADANTTEGSRSRSESESSLPPDYLILSQCETGRVSITSCSNSERSLEQSSSDNTFEDVFLSPLCTNQTLSPFISVGLSEPPLGTPSSSTPLERLSEFSSSCSSTSPTQTLHPAPDFFQFDKPATSLSPEGIMDGQTPPPRPPKPIRFSERCADNGPHHMTLRSGEGLFPLQPAPIPRRISLAGLDHVRRGEFDISSVRSWNKRLSLNLPRLNSVCSPSSVDCYEDSYIPMNSGASPPVASSDIESDGYVPMSPTSAPFLMSNGNPETPPPAAPLQGLPTDLEPPPVNRDLKPRRRARPPPLDLRALSTINECPPHLSLTRTLTEPGNSAHWFPMDRRPGITGTLGDQEDSCLLGESRHLLPANGSTALCTPRKSNLDYLSLDFNSASPSPVQKKALLADEHRVDYVQVDEKKTQALQNTKMEWKDVRQSKV
ncbi:GRB2-associated-binding protein 3-like isoform X1 [Anguilla anguilla]|uniref:GRB2-associated-binding protein 3-like isoform X1 n=1 Tax=Anguilla anguilla TaxID=7936 RepID=UPI0015A8CB93|nr:GRB2-associated-binding protein 3-like isoform X1 [Anguilla anguilla]